jgi:hypothetical protein
MRTARVPASFAAPWLLTLLMMATTACVATSAPRVRACLAPGMSSAPSSGMLRILPSQVPGVAIDSAYWQTGAGTQDIGTWEVLAYSARLRTSRRVRLAELAILYDEQEARPLPDVSVERDMEPGDTRTSVRSLRFRSTLRVGQWSGARSCPRTVRLVPRDRLAFKMMPGLASDSVRESARRALRPGGSPLVVVKEALIGDWDPQRTAIVGAAVNTADTALTDMIIALVVVRGSHPRAASPAQPGDLIEDTLEYRVGRVEPHAWVGFAGGSIAANEIVERVSYPAGRIAGRPIPTLGTVARVSELTWHRRIAEYRDPNAPFTVDTAWYVAGPADGRQVGVPRGELTVVTRWRNMMGTPLYLATCAGMPSSPSSTVVVGIGTTSGHASVLPSEHCAPGGLSMRVEPGVTRIDTLRVSIAGDAAAGQMAVGAMGRFAVKFDVRICPDDPECRIGAPMLSGSAPFRVHTTR